MTDNSESVKKDFKDRTLGDKLYASNDEGALQSNPIANDWTDLGASYFTYSSATRIAISTINPINIFQIGDRVRILQTTYKYFYIVDVTSTYIDVAAGTDYTVANASITRFSISRAITPSGFPATFNCDPNFRCIAPASLAGAPASSSFKFWVLGGFAFIDFHFDGDDLASGPTSSIVCDLPTPYSTNIDTPFFPCFGINNFVIQTAGAKIGSSVNFDVEIQIIELPGTDGFGAWQTSTNGVGIDMTFNYLIE